MLDKKFSVDDSQIWCQQGRAFVRNLAAPPGRGDSSIKKKMEFLLQANLDVSYALFVSLNWSAPRSGFTSLLFHVQLKNSSFQNTKTKRLLSSSLRRHGIIYNHGLNKVANRFGILNYLSAYNNNKIISENVGKSFCSLNSGSWLLVPDSRYDVSVWWQPLLKNAGSS